MTYIVNITVYFIISSFSVGIFKASKCERSPSSDYFCLNFLSRFFLFWCFLPWLRAFVTPFWSNWFKLDPNWSNLFKNVQTGSNLFKLDLNGSMQFKMDKISSNLIKIDQFFKAELDLFTLDEIGLKWTKLHNDRKFMLNSSYMLHGNCTRQCIRNKTFLFVKIESWNFQYLHDLEFHETSQNVIYIFWQTKKFCF